MSDGGRERASVGVRMWKSSQKWSVQRSAVRSVAWLGVAVILELATGSATDAVADMGGLRRVDHPNDL